MTKFASDKGNVLLSLLSRAIYVLSKLWKRADPFSNVLTWTNLLEEISGEKYSTSLLWTIWVRTHDRHNSFSSSFLLPGRRGFELGSRVRRSDQKVTYGHLEIWGECLQHPRGHGEFNVVWDGIRTQDVGSAWDNSQRAKKRQRLITATSMNWKNVSHRNQNRFQWPFLAIKPRGQLYIGNKRK